MDTDKPVTLSRACEIISAFLNAPNVLGVHVVGSVARERCGNDLDLVLVVDAFRYASFVRIMGEWFGRNADDTDYYGGFKDQRRSAALYLLDLPPLVNAWLQCAAQGITLDLHLMPEGWQEHVEEVQSHLAHDDPDFVRHIAHDAVVIGPHHIFEHGGVKRVRLF